MQAKKRYLLVLLSCAFLATCYLGGYRLKPPDRHNPTIYLPSYTTNADLQVDLDLAASVYLRRKLWAPGQKTNSCRMETCFDASKCSKNGFKVYVYPQTDEFGLPLHPTPSVSYQKILNVIVESRYHTKEPSEACLFVLAIDTLDRDPLSQDFVRNLPLRLQKLPYWNHGRNHLIFNLYSGTWPDYAEETLGFDYGFAILAKASMSVVHLRPGFDVSIPLFHKEHPEKGGDAGTMASNNFPAKKRHLLAFKGKRYVHGIGSETRNSLYHLHNRADMVLVTTCKHGKNWRDMKDERCDEDNQEYDRYDYEVLLQNSTFCMVPRGRRLGSYRFLEVLQAGCIPVLLSNGWALPFQEVIDWSKAVIWADERLLLQVPEIIRSVDVNQVFQMRQQTQILWSRYFSSVEKIVFTTLEVIASRLTPTTNHPRDGVMWNWSPGALVALPTFSDALSDYPFYAGFYSPDNERGNGGLTAVIYVSRGGVLAATSPLFKLVRNIAKSRATDKIVIMWCAERNPPHNSRWPLLSKSLHILQPSTSPRMNDTFIRPNTTNYSSNNNYSSSSILTSCNRRFHPHPLIDTSAILSLDEDTVLTTDEIDFAFHVWSHFPDRIVGYPARSHYWDDTKNSWGYTSKWTNEYSIVLTGAAIYHRYYNYLYTHWLSPLLHKTVEQSQNCEDILMNLLVGHVTRRPNIKLTQRKQYKEPVSVRQRSPWNDPDHFIQRQTCLNTFAAVFGYMPLMRSNMRLDPVLFKDPVSNLRKKYRQIELVGSGS